MVDIIAYSKAIDKLFIEMGTISEPYPWKVQAVLEELCDVLRIAKIELCFYKNAGDELIDKGERQEFNFSDNYAADMSQDDRHDMDGTMVMLSKYFQRVNDEAWTDEDAYRIRVLDTLLYKFFIGIKMNKLAEEALLYDRDLNIPNNNYYKNEVGRIIANNEFEDYAVAFVNLKRFTVVNQLIGRELATQVMKKFAKGLQEELGKDGVVCRFAGDNFNVLLKKSAVDRFSEYLKEREIVYDEEGASVVVHGSAGIYMGTGEDESVEEVIEKARITSKNARNDVDNKIVFYSGELQRIHEKASRIESECIDAIAKEEFRVFYQPKVQLNNYTIAGAEALCRWWHKGTFVRPDEFIPILEMSNTICALDFYMLEHVCKDIRRWLDMGLNVARVSVNFSRRHLGDEKLLDKILEIIDRHRVPHSYIEIELTETTTDVAFIDLKKIVNGLHEHGIHTSVDDFGVGYSSLNLIRQVAWDVIKIDKSLLPTMLDKAAPQYLMFSHLLAMFRELGLKCIVEGVETIEQVKMLKENKCFLAQGYFFDKPLEVAEFEKRIV